MRQEILNKLRELQKTVEQFDETKYKRNVGHLKVELKYRYNKLIDKLKLKVVKNESYLKL